MPGYDDFCNALNDPSHEPHESYKGWFAGFEWNEDVYDGERFDTQNVNYEN